MDRHGALPRNDQPQANPPDRDRHAPSQPPARQQTRQQANPPARTDTRQASHQHGRQTRQPASHQHGRQTSPQTISTRQPTSHTDYQHRPTDRRHRPSPPPDRSSARRKQGQARRHSTTDQTTGKTTRQGQHGTARATDEGKQGKEIIRKEETVPHQQAIDRNWSGDGQRKIGKCDWRHTSPTG